MVYIVPQDAELWPDARRRATETLQDLQWFFADQMNLLGYGPKTFKIDYAQDGGVQFCEVKPPLKKEQLGVGRRQIIKSSRRLIPRLSKEYAQLCFLECYTYSGGALSGVTAGYSKHRAYLSSLYLKVALREWLQETRGYGGEVFPWISSEPLKDDTLSWKGRGKQLGDISGAAFGTIAHELEHCFGPDHNAGEDERERNGHLMGSGDIKFRGVFRPDLTDRRCVLSKKDAEMLNGSPFFAVRKDLRPKGRHWVRG